MTKLRDHPVITVPYCFLAFSTERRSGPFAAAQPRRRTGPRGLRSKQLSYCGAWGEAYTARAYLLGGSPTCLLNATLKVLEDP